MFSYSPAFVGDSGLKWVRKELVSGVVCYKLYYVKKTPAVKCPLKVISPMRSFS
jgi:hypothetical protein